MSGISHFSIHLLLLLTSAWSATAAYGDCPGAQYPPPFQAYEGHCKLQGDFNKDGVSDLVFVGRANVFTLMNGDPEESRRIVALQYPSDAFQGYIARLADSSGDGIPDLVFIGKSVSFRYNGKSDGSFDPTATNPYAAYEGYRNLQGDFDKDGVQDLVFVGNSAVFTLMAGDPDPRRRVTALLYPSQAYDGYSAKLVDDSGDGIPDLLFTGERVVFRYNGRSDGSFDTTATSTLLPSAAPGAEPLASALVYQYGGPETSFPECTKTNVVSDNPLTGKVVFCVEWGPIRIMQHAVFIDWFSPAARNADAQTKSMARDCLQIGIATGVAGLLLSPPTVIAGLEARIDAVEQGVRTCVAGTVLLGSVFVKNIDIRVRRNDFF